MVTLSLMEKSKEGMTFTLGFSNSLTNCKVKIVCYVTGMHYT